MTKSIFLFLLGILSLSAIAQPKLSEEVRISLMTSTPYDEEVFTVYGHVALCIYDLKQNVDYIFNYGISDFSKPNFIYRFVKGEADYKLGVADFQDYVIEYQIRGSGITEQVLNLTREEKEHTWDALLINHRSENRVYCYNFLFDNCTTRSAAILEKEIEGSVDYQYPYQSQIFRDLINYCTRNHPWLTFGCDLALGSPTDREATQHKMLFLPPYLEEAFSKTTIMDPDGTTRPLVSETHVVGAGKADEPEEDIWDLFTPLVCAWLLFGIVLGLTWIEWRKKRYFPWVDCVLFSVAGAGSVILFFFSFISVHPCTQPNWSLVWLQPLDLIAVILFCVKKLKKAAYYYHFINFAALTLMLLGWHFIPQHLNSAFIPLVVSIWVRSGWGVYRKIWRIG